MLTLTLIALLAGPVIAGQRPLDDVLAPRADRCQPGSGIADYRRPRPPSMKLGDQPPANHFRAVYNRVGDCPQPIVLRKGIGGNREQTVPTPPSPPRLHSAN